MARLPFLAFLLGLTVPVNCNVVYLFRHCVRSVSPKGLEAYAARPFPSFGVKADYCLPRGLRIYTGIGSHLRDTLHNPRVVVDNVPRNIDSGHALATGLGVKTSDVSVDGAPFSKCKGPSKKVKQDLVSKRFLATAPPSNASAMIAAIDKVLGGNKTIASQKDQIVEGKLVGKSELAASAAENFMMQYGGGMTVGWGEVDGAMVMQLLQMQVYSWKVTHHLLPFEQAHSSKMLSTILEALADAQNNETIFIGHDGDLAAIGTMLNIGWKASPFPDNTTAPSMGLRFESVSNLGGASPSSVRIDAVHTTFDTDSGPVLSTPVLEESVSKFCDRADKGIDKKCASPTIGLCSSKMQSLLV